MDELRPPSIGVKWHVVWFSLMQLLIYFERGLVAGCIMQLMTAFDVDQASAGLMNSLAIGGFLFGAPFGSPLTKIFGHPVRTMAFGELLMAIGALWMWANTGNETGFGVNMGFAMICASRFANGIGEAFVATLAPPILDSIAPAGYKAQYLGVYFTSIPFGYAFGMAATWTSSYWHEARWLYFIVGCVWLLLTVGFAVTAMKFSDGRLAGPRMSTLSLHHSVLPTYEYEPPPEGKEPLMGEYREQLSTILKNPIWWFLTLTYATQTWFLGGAITWGITFIAVVFRKNDASLFVSAGTLVMTVLGTIVGSRLVDVLEPSSGRLRACTTVVFVSMLFLAPVAVVTPLLDIYLAFYTCVVVSIFFCITAMSPINIGIMQTVPFDARSTALGLTVSVMHLLGDVPSNLAYGWTADAVAKDDLQRATVNGLCTFENLQNSTSQAVTEACDKGQRWGYMVLAAGACLSVLCSLLALCLSKKEVATGRASIAHLPAHIRESVAKITSYAPSEPEVSGNVRFSESPAT